MHTISNLARNAAVPRRTVQYWHDKKVILPLSMSPVVYSNDELILVRILAALTQSKPAISWIAEIAKILRLCIAGDPTVPPDVAEAFAAARAGQTAFFGLAPAIMADGKTIQPWTFGATTEADAWEAVMSQLKHRANLGCTIVDLQYCLNLESQVGTIFEEI